MSNVQQETNETILLKGLAENDNRATQIIYRNNYNVVKSLVINNNGTDDDAKDIFQEAIVVLYEKVKYGTAGLNCQISTFLFAVAKRLWLKRLQQQKMLHNKIDAADETVLIEDDLTDHAQKNSEFESLTKAINQLGEPCRSLIEAYYLQKKNMQEISEEFGYTNADNAKNQKYKCLMRLKKIFFSTYKNENS